jgi:hypothetical protein
MSYSYTYVQSCPSSAPKDCGNVCCASDQTCGDNNTCIEPIDSTVLVVRIVIPIVIGLVVLAIVLVVRRRRAQQNVATIAALHAGGAFRPPQQQVAMVNFGNTMYYPAGAAAGPVTQGYPAVVSQPQYYS